MVIGVQEVPQFIMGDVGNTGNAGNAWMGRPRSTRSGLTNPQVCCVLTHDFRLRTADHAFLAASSASRTMLALSLFAGDRSCPLPGWIPSH